MADKPKKCKHPGCQCDALEGSDYCGAYCAAAGKRPSVQCECGHAACEATATATATAT